MKTNCQLSLLIGLLLCHVDSSQADWKKIEAVPPHFTNCITVIGNSIFVGTELSGIFRSTDSGKSWSQVDTGLGSVAVNAFAGSTDHIFAAAYGTGVFLTTDNGDHWSKIDTGFIYPTFNSLLMYGSSLFVGMNDGVYATTNSGATWDWHWSSFDDVGPHTVDAFAAIGNTIFAGTYGHGVYYWWDNRIWCAANAGLTNNYVNSLCVLGSWLYAGTEEGVCVSLDNAHSWTARNHGLTDTHIRSLIFDGSYLFAGTNQGVYYSSNCGVDWFPFNSGLAESVIRCLAIYNSVLYAGSQDGLWERPLSEITDVEYFRVPSISTFGLNRNFPNPFNPATTISFELSSECFASLAVYDLQGRRVACLVSEKVAAGRHTVVWNAGSLPTGVYSYQLRAGLHTETRRCVLLK